MGGVNKMESLKLMRDLLSFYLRMHVVQFLRAFEIELAPLLPYFHTSLTAGV